MAGIGETLWACPDFTEDDLIGRLDVLDQAGVAALVANDMFFGPGGPPAVVQIPYAWLTPRIVFRPDAPYTSAAVGQSGGGTGYAADANSLAEYGSNEYAATLSTLGPADPLALATYVMTYYATQPGAVPRQRVPGLVINLLPRSPTEIQKILGLRVGQHIQITGTPGAGGVINLNPYFEVDLSDWNGQNGATATQSSAVAHQGTQAMLITPDGVNANPGAISVGHPVQAGQPYTASAWVYSPLGYSDVRTGATFFDAAGNFVNSSIGTGSAVPTAAWTFLTQVFVAPVGAALGEMRIRMNGVAAGTDLLYVDEATLTGPFPAPGGWPEGATHQVIEGISDSIGLNERLRSLRTSPVIGSTPGTVGPWFRFDSSVWGGTDVLPF